MHLRAKFCQNWSIGSEDIRIFRFFKMAAAAILDFQILKFYWLTVSGGSDASLCQISSKSVVPLQRYCDFSKRWQPPPPWIFEITKFYWLMGSIGSRQISDPNFVKIGQSVVKILRFLDFSRWRLSAILDLFMTHLDHPQRVLAVIS